MQVLIVMALVACATASNFHGIFPGKCQYSGLYYKDEKSFIICSNGIPYAQYCAPGTANSPYNKYAHGKTYSARSFCDVNLNDHGYAAHKHQAAVYKAPAKPVYKPAPAYAPKPVHKPEPSYAPKPVYHPAPVHKPEPSYAPKPVYHPAPVYKPQPSYAPKPVYHPAPVYKPQPSYAPKPVYHPAPVYKPEPSYAPKPVYKPEPVYKPVASYAPEYAYKPAEPAYKPEPAAYRPVEYKSAPAHYAPSSYVYHGKYPGKCQYDGLYYNDEKSFIYCSNGNSYVQNCAPGSRNSGYTEHTYGKSYGRVFCDVNLVDHGYAAKKAVHAPKYVAPAPKYVAPAPKYVAPAPKYVAPAPKYVAPAPKYVAPAPKYVAPAPKYVAPAPKYPVAAPKYTAPAPKYPAPAPKYESMYHGKYPGKCGYDGLYYNDEKSFIFCAHGIHTIQYCAPGSRNAAYSTYNAGNKYNKAAFCTINLVDHGYAAIKAVHGH